MKPIIKSCKTPNCDSEVRYDGPEYVTIHGSGNRGFFSWLFGFNKTPTTIEDKFPKIIYLMCELGHTNRYVLEEKASETVTA